MGTEILHRTPGVSIVRWYCSLSVLRPALTRRTGGGVCQCVEDKERDRGGEGPLAGVTEMQLWPVTIDTGRQCHCALARRSPIGTCGRPTSVQCTSMTPSFREHEDPASWILHIIGRWVVWSGQVIPSLSIFFCHMLRICRRWRVAGPISRTDRS
ncbi:hypothetical protein L226DRAFT_68461 [Lentinus tigrinus ALCF2SS1-7]|uniref:Uncharacterized protein n=1 Tax=Lentinus tigrinus ALCF2SS1-6 TaxID=1328759 RepID=A0A5C2S914_9APHY|nr:hypothetical protein L227DRAFT_109656 [Lentinus tigrinus ALCF2SS1-6]RPD74916.1 hypothetical protein L226DRAFT_68461 [Lentinus tigrinus ALCF2SS1-7]